MSDEPTSEAQDIETIEEEEPECDCCHRTYSLLQVLDGYFGKNIRLHDIGSLNTTLCTQCLKRLRKIVLEQVYYGDPKCKADVIQKKCLHILFHQNRPNIDIDIELYELLVEFKELMDVLKGQSLSLNEVCEQIVLWAREWSSNHKHKAITTIEPCDTKLSIYVRLCIGSSRTEGFKAVLMIDDIHRSELIIPYKVE